MPTPDHDRGPTTTPDAGAPAARPASPGDVPPMPPATRLLIGILVAAAFVVILNETTLSVAMPVIMDQFAVTPGAAQWLTTGFMVTTAVVIPLTGWILQRFSTRAVYIAALTIFLAGTLVAAFAPVFAVLLLGRIVQAVGTALVMPLLMTTIIELVPMERRGSVFGLMSVVIAAAPALGPTVSGLILEGLGWRWIFGVMTPLIVIMLVVGAVLVKNVGQAGRPVLDVPSVGLSAVGFAAALYGLSGLGEIAQGAAPFVPVGSLVVGLVVLAVFVRRQERLRRGGRSPLLNLEPMRIREFVLSLVLLLLAFGMLFGFIILMPLFAQDVMGLSQFTTGLTTLPGGVVMAVTGPLVGRAFDVRGTRPLIIPGGGVPDGRDGRAGPHDGEHLRLVPHRRDRHPQPRGGARHDPAHVERARRRAGADRLPRQRHRQHVPAGRRCCRGDRARGRHGHRVGPRRRARGRAAGDAQRRHPCRVHHRGGRVRRAARRDGRAAARRRRPPARRRPGGGLTGAGAWGRRTGWGSDLRGRRG
ncbi:MFS transporter [Corynebacterium bovis]|uniref:MFS transporter n=1 Tax=Corynebacterium bovis TaxID=36808 RepID=UPI0031389070